MTPSTAAQAPADCPSPREGDLSSAWPVRLLWAQGAYYLLTGVWPLVSIETFQMVTGPKTDHLQSPSPTEADHWLVMTVGVLITAVAVSLLTAAWRRSASAEVAALAVSAAAGLAAIDVLYVYRRVIAPVYLVDAGLEVALIAAWALALAAGRRTGRRA